DDHPVQLVVDDATVPFESIDLTGVPAGERDTALMRGLKERAQRPFTLASDVLFRAAVFKLASDEHVLFLLTHHIVSDGWTKSITFREISELYAAEATGRAASLPPLTEQFGDYARHERERVAGDALESSLGYWRQKLHAPLPTLSFIADQPPGIDAF